MGQKDRLRDGGASVGIHAISMLTREWTARRLVETATVRVGSARGDVNWKYAYIWTAGTPFGQVVLRAKAATRCDTQRALVYL